MPWGHLGIAYLLYTLYSRLRYGHPPRDLPAITLAVASQFPDIVDKPLAWHFGVLPGGRTLTHSLFSAAIILLVVYIVTAWFDRTDVAVAFGIGHVSHSFLDVPPGVFMGDPSGAAFLLWPLFEQTMYEPYGSSDVVRRLYFRTQIFVFVLAIVVWYRDGMPPLGTVRALLKRGVSRIIAT